MEEKIDRRRNTLDDYYRRIDYNGANGCWLWTGRQDRDGYGRWNFDGKEMFAHRFAYDIYYKDLDPKLVIMHSCDNPPCVNPEHLSQGTQKDNMQDAAKKGRKPSGSKNPNSKLNEYQVEKIRQFYKVGLSIEELSKTFNVSRRQIFNIVHEIHWKSKV